jgi:hypothetical protein
MTLFNRSKKVQKEAFSKVFKQMQYKKKILPEKESEEYWAGARSAYLSMLREITSDSRKFINLQAKTLSEYLSDVAVRCGDSSLSNSESSRGFSETLQSFLK